MNKTSVNYLKIALAGVLWGTLGLFGKTLQSYGLSAPMIAFCRLSAAFILMSLFFCVKDPSVLRISAKGLMECALIGIVSQGFFNFAYFSSIRLVGAFTAVVLLYFSIVIMFFLGTFFYREKPSKKKLFSVLLCSLGAVLGVTGGDFSSLQTDTLGIVMGLLASLAYSLMPALGKKTATRYNPFTIVIYSFLSGAIFLIPFAKPWTVLSMKYDASMWGVIFLFALIASTIPYGLYLPSLHNIQISKLGVITSIELVVSIMIAIFWLKEDAGWGKILGCLLILLSIYIMNSMSIPFSKQRYNTNVDSR